MARASLRLCIALVVLILVVEVVNGFSFAPRALYQRVLLTMAAAGVPDANAEFPLQNTLMIRAARGETVECTPVWVFRQAGRHLPEYNEYKRSRGKNFLELLDDPVDVAECTMQPIRRYNLDAAILFSDILVILQALGMEVAMPGGLGITVPKPLATPAEVSSRLPSSVDVRKELSHVLAAVRLIKQELKGKVPLIGFSAAPWTLMYYMVGGSSKQNQKVASKWLKDHPAESKQLLDLLTTIVIDYMSAQVDEGADMIQVFEAMGEYISQEDFNTWALPTLQKICTELRRRHPNTPLLVFPRGAPYALADLQQAGFDVVSLDTKTDRTQARTLLKNAANVKMPPHGRISGLQGNFDVALLQAGASTPEEVKAATHKMVEELGPHNLIANLGEGLTGKEDPALVAAFIDSVHEVSRKIIAAGGQKVA